MSTTIGSGFRVRAGSLLVLHERLSALRGPIRDLQRRADAAFLCHHAVHAIDLAAARGEGVARPLSAARNELDERRRKITTTGHRDPAVDLDFSVGLMPYGKFVYGMIFTEHRDWADLLLAQPWAEPFHYWNGTDRDPNVPARDWARRGRVWGAIFQRDSRPSQCGMTFEVLPAHHAVPLEDILALVPPLERRAHLIATDRLTYERCASDPERGAEDGTAWMRSYQRARAWLREPEGAEALRALTERLILLLPTIDDTILRDGLPSKAVAGRAGTL